MGADSPLCGEPLYRRLDAYYRIRIFCLACGWEEKPLTREQLLGKGRV
ncbi:MAG: hypothetical protein QW502_03060 [Candidatus Bathyarchaeia archaeon]